MTIGLNELFAQLGKTREQVIESIGDPDEISTGTRKYPTPMIFKYGRYELTFMPWKSGVASFVFDSVKHETVRSEPSGQQTCR